MEEMIREFLPYSLTFIAAMAASILAYKGSRKTGKDDALTNAANLHSNYADRMEKRVLALEEKEAKSAKLQEATDKELRATNRRLDDVVEENEKYRELISQVILWITELLEWETQGRRIPAPAVSLSMILNHLTSAIDQQRGKHDKRAQEDNDGPR